MFSLFRYKKNGLPHALITVHELVTRDIFDYFEKGRFARKKVRNAQKAIKAAIRFATKKKTYPSNKTADALNALGQIDDEIAYTHKAILTAYQEAENIVALIRQEKVGEIIPLVEKAKERFRDHDLDGGIALLKQVQERLKSPYLPVSRKKILGGLDSEIKKLKSELLERKRAKRERPAETIACTRMVGATTDP